ncbi:hypothetical protein DYB26_011985, partial [Aphanomyces astaci]
MAAWRANQRSTESEEDRRKRLSIQSANQAAIRRMESPEQHALRLQQLKAKRVMESPEEHTERLRKLKALRDMEAPEARATRLQNLKAQRDMESSEKHRARLDNLKAQRSVESADERAVRLSKHKNKRKLELQEDRAVRLKAMNLQHAAQRSVESSDARSRRLGYLKAQRKALRVSESVEEREGRLQRRRQGHHRVQQAKNDEVTASEAQCSALDDAGLLHECSKDMKSEILRQLGFALGPSGMDQCVCCVCDRLSFVTDVHMHSTADKGILQSMAARLRNPEVQLSDDLVAYYDCKDIHPAFVGLMLSRKGITHAGNVNDIENPSDVDFNVCLECETVLLQPWRSELPRHYVFPGEPVDSERDIDHEFDDDDEHAIAYADQEACLYDDPIEDNDGSSIDALAEVEFPDFSEIPVESWPLPPKHAIANHFFVGELPDELFKATWAEMLMCSLVSVVAQTRIIRGGEHRMIRSHLILFDAVPGPPATLLPLKLNRDAMYRVVLAGPFTKDQLVKVKEYHLVRQAMIMDVLQFYKSNNGFYADVSIDGDLIASLPMEDVLDGIIDEALGVGEKASAVDNEQAAVNGFSGDPDEGSSEHECAYVERSVLFTQTASDLEPVNEKAVLEALKSKIHQRTPRSDPAVPEFNVHTSNKISNYFKAGIDARMFPHLFPFGRGYTNERGRRVPVSKLQCCRLYCSLSSRRFAQDRYFVMVSFDRFGLDRGFINSNFSTKVRPSMHTP